MEIQIFMIKDVTEVPFRLPSIITNIFHFIYFHVLYALCAFLHFSINLSLLDVFFKSPSLFKIHDIRVGLGR